MGDSLSYLDNLLVNIDPHGNSLYMKRSEMTVVLTWDVNQRF